MQMRLRELAMAVAAVYAAGITPTLFPAIDGLSGISAAHAATSTTTQDAATLESEIKKLQAEIDALNQAIVDLQQKLTTNLSASQRQAVLQEIKKLERVLKTKQNQLADLQAQLSKLQTTEPAPTDPVTTEPVPTDPVTTDPTTTPSSGTFTSNPQFANLVANSALALGAYNPPALSGCNQYSTGITDYSRLTYDSANNQILMFGGGHATTPRTDVDVLNLQTLTWGSAYPATPTSDLKVANFDRNTGGWVSTGHPTARHTYDMLTYAPNARELILLKATDAQPGCTELWTWEDPGKIWHYNPSTKQWTPTGASPLWTNYATASEYDPVSGKIVLIDAYGLYIYDPLAKVATKPVNFVRGELSYSQNLVYFPPTDKMYYVMDNGTIFEVTLDRTNFANSTVLPVSGITGTPPKGGETGWAYDSVNKIVGGGVKDGVFYAFDPTAKTWTARTINVVGGTPAVGSVAFHTLDYDPVDNVFIFLGRVPTGGGGAAFTTWAYRYGGTSPTSTTTPTDTSTADPTPTPSTGAAEDFSTRCNAAGVVRCVSFDADADISGRWGANSGITVGTVAAPTIDAGVRASGGGSLKFTIPSNSGSDSSGSYFANFSNDLSVQFGENSEFFVQWRQRFSDAFISTFFAGNSGIKQAIINTGDTPTKVWASCEAIGNVLTSYYQERFTTVYNSCTGSGTHGAYTGLYEGIPGSGGNLKLQNAMPSPYCTYLDGEAVKSPAFPAGCFGWYANEWMTFQVGITLGPRDNTTNDFTNSRLRMWVAREGQPSVLVIDWKPGIPGYFPLAAGPLSENQKFGKIWLLPYQTTKDSTQVHPTAYTWYDELIISKTQIPDPK